MPSCVKYQASADEPPDTADITSIWESTDDLARPKCERRQAAEYADIDRRRPQSSAGYRQTKVRRGSGRARALHRPRVHCRGPLGCGRLARHAEHPPRRAFIPPPCHGRAHLPQRFLILTCQRTPDPAGVGRGTSPRRRAAPLRHGEACRAGTRQSRHGPLCRGRIDSGGANLEVDYASRFPCSLP